MINIKIKYWDIEALPNVFMNTIYWKAPELVEIYYICDNKSLLNENGDYIDEASLKEKVYEVNKSELSRAVPIKLYNLAKEEYAARYACQFIKLSFKGMPLFINETDNGFDEDKNYYLLGYNSTNYDLTMQSYYIGGSWNVNTEPCTFTGQMTAEKMYKFNNELFKNKEHMVDVIRDTPLIDIYYKMLNSGRHLDVSGFNEKQSKVALKGLAGLLGYQIKESDLLDQGNITPITTVEEFNDLAAYNVSDTISTSKVFENDVYQSNYEVKSGLLKSYPELIYKQKRNGWKKKYAPDIRPSAVSNGRLRADSTSARLASKCLCPYDHLDDIPEVSFMYPSEEKAKELGIKRFNVLDDLMAWYADAFKDFPEIVEAFKTNIYNYYKNIEGKNFNSGEQYKKKYGNRACFNPKTMAPITQNKATPIIVNGCIEYFTKEGTSSGCFAQFSLGGIHGAEFNLPLYMNDLKEYRDILFLFNQAKEQYPNAYDLRVAKTVEVDGSTYSYSYFLKSGSKLSDPDSCEYKEPVKPLLFKLKDNNYILNDKYKYTSSDIVDHEDFSSYYPNLFINLGAFKNDGLGYDRYKEIYDLKEEYGQKKKAAKEESQKAVFEQKRSGTKLILNSASGAADLYYDTPIRMNNMTLSMRLIGQFFTFRIAQEQTLAGARVKSTNTDGIYVKTPNKEKTRAILSNLEKLIHVGIEPEEMYLISKDTNNRIELSADGKEILSASGGTLSCYKKPEPTSALSHPAIVDNVLVTLLRAAREDLTKEPSEELIKKILQQYIATKPLWKTCLMFQNIIKASKNGFKTLVTEEFNDLGDISLVNCKVLQKYNRIFYVKEGNGYIVEVTEKVPSKARPKNESDAKELLKKYGIKEFDSNKMTAFVRANSIDPKQSVIIYNQALKHGNQDDLRAIVDNLDLDAYARLIHHTYKESWQNKN